MTQTDDTRRDASRGAPRTTDHHRTITDDLARTDGTDSRGRTPGGHAPGSTTDRSPAPDGVAGLEPTAAFDRMPDAPTFHDAVTPHHGTTHERSGDMTHDITAHDITAHDITAHGITAHGITAHGITAQDARDTDRTAVVDGVPDAPAGTTRAPGDAATTFAAPGRRPRSLIRRARRTHILQPGSVAAARATVDAGAMVFPRQGHVRKLVLGVPLALLAGDAVALAVESAVVRGNAADAVVFAVMVLFARAAMHHYRPRFALALLDDLPRGIGSTLGGLGLSVGVSALIGHGEDAGGDLLLRGVVFLAASIVLQAIVFAVIRRARRRRSIGRRTLIVGAGRVGVTLAEAMLEHPELGLFPVGFADPDVATADSASALPVLTSDMSRLPRTIIDHEIDTTVLAFNGTGDAHVDTIIAVHQTGCNILLVPSMFELHHDGPDVDRVRGIPLLRLRPDPTLRLGWWVKRSVDVAAGALGLLVLSPLLLLVAVVSLVDSGRPLLFWQERIGLDGRPFRLCKFRSMRPESELESATTWNIAKDPRVTSFGRFLRRSSIDEIPQLWNIARGQMSLVGPRPERPTFVQQFSAEHDRYWARHRVPVGLTGLAQVNGLRGDTSIRERARYDNYYIANWSLWLDVKILLLTVREVLGGRGR